MSSSISVVESINAKDIVDVQELWKEYWQALGLTADFQDFTAELHTLPGKYAPPAGRLLLARLDGQPAGTAAFRPLCNGACEAKRLYVRPAYRRRGIAGTLLDQLAAEARRSGYRNLYGDTLATMGPALDFYRRMGFEEVAPYSKNPTPGAIYLRLRL